MDKADCFTTELYELVAGPEHKRFLVHAGILSKSFKFNAIVQGGWKESSDRKIILEDWDAATVSCLVQWLYNDQYIVPLSHAGRSTSQTNQAGESEINQHGLPAPSQKPNARYPNMARMYSAKYINAMSFHVKVYALASYVLLESFRNYACSKVAIGLHDLRHFQKHPGSMDRFIAFTGSVYANTQSSPESQDPLRKTVMNVFARNLSAFTGEQTKQLEEDCEDFARDLSAVVKERAIFLKQILLSTKATLTEYEAEQETGSKRKLIDVMDYVSNGVDLWDPELGSESESD